MTGLSVLQQPEWNIGCFRILSGRRQDNMDIGTPFEGDLVFDRLGPKLISPDSSAAAPGIWICRR